MRTSPCRLRCANGGGGVLPSGIRTARASSVRAAFHAVAARFQRWFARCARHASRIAAAPSPRCDLKHVALAVRVVADHVEHVDARDLDVRDVATRTVFGREREPLLDERLADRARAERVGRELLAGGRP